MIARAWMDESYRAELAAQGIEVPARPDDLADDQLDLITVKDREYNNTAPQSCSC
jgi:hypothetical protein